MSREVRSQTEPVWAGGLAFFETPACSEAAAARERRLVCRFSGQSCFEPGGDDAVGHVDWGARRGLPGVHVVFAVHVKGGDQRGVGGLGPEGCWWPRDGSVAVVT